MFELIIGITSLVMFVGTLAAVPWLVKRLPADYFVRPPPKHSLATKIARNALGFALIAAGVAMLVLPGQGILTILIGMSIVDLPIKQRVLRRILRQPKVQQGVQRLRASAGKPPLVIPAPRESVTSEAPARARSGTASVPEHFLREEARRDGPA